MPPPMTGRSSARCSTARTRRLPSGRIAPTDPRRTWSCWCGGACAPRSSTRSHAARRCRPTSPEAMPRGPASAHTSSTSSLPRSTASASSFAPSASSGRGQRSVSPISPTTSPGWPGTTGEQRPHDRQAAANHGQRPPKPQTQYCCAEQQRCPLWTTALQPSVTGNSRCGHWASSVGIVVGSTKEAAMNLYVALHVSLEFTAVCVMDEEGELVLERKVASDPAAIAGLLFELPERPCCVGLEAGPLSEWLARGLAQAGLDAVLMETRHVRAALSAMVAKTDRNDARGMAQLLRMGWFRPVHRKTMNAREQRALLAARSTLGRRLRDVENSVRGILRGFGIRIPRLLRGRWSDVRGALQGNTVLLGVSEPLFAATQALRD